jgi:hypothetical protein
MNSILKNGTIKLESLKPKTKIKIVKKHNWNREKGW